MAPQPFHVRRFDDYVDALQKAKVVLDADRRKAIILADAKNLAFAQGSRSSRTKVCWRMSRAWSKSTIVLMGEFEAFLDLCGRSDPRHHPRQSEMLHARKARHDRPLPRHGRPSTGHRGAPQDQSRHGRNFGTAWMAGSRPAMTQERPRVGFANKFILNLVADDGAAITAGNGRVVRAPRRRTPLRD